MLLPTMAVIFAVALPISALSTWLVLRRGVGLRLVALTMALLIALTFIVMFWVARLLNPGWFAFGLLVGLITYGSWYLSRRQFEEMFSQAGREVRW